MSDRVSTSTPKFSEQQLLQNLHSGDLSAFWDLWLMYQPYLLSRCFRWTNGNHSDAEEILSLAMCHAWEQIPRYATSLKNPKAWLTRLTHNLCVNQQLKRGRQAISLGDMEQAVSEVHSLPVVSTLDPPEAALLKREFHSYLSQLIQDLTPSLRTPLLLYYFQGLSCMAIAQQEQISLAVVYKRLQLARDTLRPRVQQYFKGQSHLATVPDATPLGADWVSTRPMFGAYIHSSTHEHSPKHSSKHIHEEIDYTILATCLIALHPGLSKCTEPMVPCSP